MALLGFIAYSFHISSCYLHYLKGRNFLRKKISRISRILAKFAKINSFFDPRKYRFAKINFREMLQISDSRNFSKINDMRILQFLFDTVSFESGLLETTGYLVICLSKKVSIFTETVLKTINYRRGKNIPKGKR